MDLPSRRPKRADARRNFDALLAAARETFAEQGAQASLDEIARRSGVSIATLYRNFPTREDLIEEVYLQEVDELCQAADGLDALPPWEALVRWLRRYIDYIVAKQALADGLNRAGDRFQASREALYAAGTPLLVRAQEAGVASSEPSMEDVLMLIAAISTVQFMNDEQRERVLRLGLAGLRA